MKRLSITLTSIILALLFTVMSSVQVVGAAENGSDYISEVKVFMAKEEADAKSALESEGYTLLDCNLNQDAEGGVMSKGKKATYLGYKTTKKSREAITDLAVMNMKGGYSTEDYEALMDKYISGEIEPFLDGFLSAIKEYRTNYNSSNSVNKARAKAIHDLLNRFKDDDTGAYIGDLLLNETKYEMGDEAYKKLSDDEKKQHADIVTIFAQANGQATLQIENLITRGGDTNDDTWIDRFSEITYDDLVDSTGKTPTDAKSDLAKKYDDDANTIIDDLWDNFKKDMEGYEEAVKAVEDYDSSSYYAAAEELENLSDDATDDEKDEVYETYLEELDKLTECKDNIQTITVHDYLSDIDYDDGTLLDFFLQNTSSDDFDITCVYPMVASLSDGQRSGIDFVSLKELCVMAITDEEGYSKIDAGEIPEASVYDGVDREIYAPGGVAVTSDALRTDAISKMNSEDSSKLSNVTIAMWCVTGVLFAAFATSLSVSIAHASSATTAVAKASSLAKEVGGAMHNSMDKLENKLTLETLNKFNESSNLDNVAASFTSSSNLCKYLSIGFGVAMVVMSAISIWLTFRDLKEYYQVDFTPQPRYMVEETDITGYNKKGEKIVIKNQSAYYKIVETNRDESAEFFKTLGTGNDLNGDVGQQWLTLYAVRMEGKDPILANSLKAVVDSADVPAGYEIGIHMFGEDTAYNLNNTNFVWDEDAPSINVYYKTDDSTVSAGGSFFTGGYIALAAGAGLLIGAGLTAIIITVVRKKKAKKA